MQESVTTAVLIKVALSAHSMFFNLIYIMGQRQSSKFECLSLHSFSSCEVEGWRCLSHFYKLLSYSDSKHIYLIIALVIDVPSVLLQGHPLYSLQVYT